MFGYIRPFKPELKIREFDEYKSYYCTLCKTLDREYGFLAKFFLNYDFAFLSLLLISLKDDKVCFKKAKCTFNFMKNCIFCTNSDETFKFVADISIIFLHYKLKDNISDDNFIKKIIALFICCLTSRAYKKASKKQPYIENCVKNAMEKQSIAEKTDLITIWQAAEPSAVLLGEVCSHKGSNEVENRVLYELGYNLGRWVYIIDALDDYEKDLKSKNFNPFIKSKECASEYEEVKVFAKSLLEECITGYENAFLLLDFKYNKRILENILFEGNPFTYHKIIRKRV